MSGEYQPNQLPAGLITAAALANALAQNYGICYVDPHDIPAGGGGAPDDVQLHNAATKRKCKIAATLWNCTTAVGAATVTVRDAAGGLGNALSGALDSATADDSRLSLGTATALAINSSVWLRRSDSAVAGQLLIFWTPAA